jgi:glycosyltransferase involved in cell wall biosynthesis
MSRLRVLHFYKAAIPESMGGVEQFIHQLARGGAPLGVHSDVLALSRGPAPDTSAEGYRSHRARLDLHLRVASTGVSISAVPRFARLARDADIVHFHFPWPFMDLVHFATRHGKPTLVTYHSDIVRQQTLLKVYRPLQDRFLASMDRIVATSPNYAESSEVLRRQPGKVDVIPIGLDQASYPVPDAARLQAWRERMGPRFFVFVGVIRYYKGLEFLLEALRGQRWPVAIVGAGPELEGLQARAAELGLEHVHFLGALPDADKMALLQLAEAMVFPSHLRSEAFGISLLEAAMVGKPMVSCEIGTGTSWINQDGVTGFVVPPCDPPALREAMRRLWDEPQLAAEMGARAKARFHALFTADKMVRDYVRLYDQLIRAASA